MRNSEEIREVVAAGDAADLTPEEARWALDFYVLKPEEAVRLGVKVKGGNANDLGTEDTEEDEQPENPGDVDTKLPPPADPFSNGSDEDKALEDMDKSELQDQARLRDLPTSGTKDEILSRITEHDEANPDGNDEG